MAKARHTAVRTQMPSGRARSGNPGRENLPAPFDFPHSTGGGGIPTRVMEDIGAKALKKLPASGMVSRSSLGTQATQKKR
jgi:hypothetical protein